jgi:transcriptional regulator with XRE-family HTH domain
MLWENNTGKGLPIIPIPIDKEVSMTAHEKIRIIRQLSKQPQSEFGNSMGLSKATISNIETGRVPVPKYVVILLKNLYNIDPDWLMDDEQEDISKRFYDQSSSDDSLMIRSITEKFNKLDSPKKIFISNCLEHLLEMQKEESLCE